MDVALLQCEEYDLDLVKAKIRQAFKLIDIPPMKNTDRVFIKLNCVGPFAPEMGITTHPIFVQAVIQIVKEYTNNILIGDNPATKDIVYTLRKNNILEVINKENIPIFDGKESIIISNPDGLYFTNFEVSKQMMDVDVLINLPKLKTHSLTYATIAQKNLFGAIYGLSKATWHVRAPNPLQFSEALNDLYGAILLKFKNKVMLHLCDGIVGLEGEGPSTAGSPIHSKVILASLDAVSLDRVAMEVMGLDYTKQIINVIANKRELGEGDLKKITIKGDKLSNFSSLKFQAPKDALSIPYMRLLKIKNLRNLILEYPLIDYNKCIKCGECIKICQSKAMLPNKEKSPFVIKKECIRCWCCAEVCPVNAISKSKRPLLGRILLRKK